MPGPTLTHSRKAQRLAIAGSVLLLILLASIAALWWADNRNSGQSAGSHPPGTSLRIERPGFPSISVQQQADDQWQIVEPCLLPAHMQRLQPLLSALMPAAHSYASQDVDLDAAGLITPEAIVYLDEERLALGTTDLSGERRYLQRGDRVEFVPEWLLSLVNGGLSALAVTTLFPGGLDALQLEPLLPEQTDAEIVDRESLTFWRSLSAQQIVTWPLSGNEMSSGYRTLLAESAGEQLTLTVYDFQRFAAIRFENASCAYIVNRSSLPDFVFP